jgi:hypothetical protein
VETSLPGSGGLLGLSSPNLLPSLKVFSVPLPGSIENKVKKNPLRIYKKENQNGRIKKFDSF